MPTRSSYLGFRPVLVLAPGAIIDGTPAWRIQPPGYLYWHHTRKMREDTMNIRASITPIAQALLVSAIVLIAGNGKSYGQADTDKVKAVIDAYHAALSALDATKMAALWARDDSVMDIEPSDKAITLAVIDAYHAALSALDATKMAALWARDDSVMDIEPSDKAITLGWQAVKKNFEEEFSGFSELKVTQGNGPNIRVKDDVAWSTGIANATLKTKEGTAATVRVFETDVFEKRDGQWLLVSHTASQVPK
jgi:uncharacterized protein (TIGR02246 family)